MSFANPLLHKPARGLPKRVVVVGAGTIGPDIGYYLKTAIPDLTLHLVDVAQAPLDRALQRFKTYARKGVERGKLSAVQADKVMDNVHATLDYEVAREADWVLEAATEDIALKCRIFARLEEIIRPEATITSNTSSLPAERMFCDLRHKNRATVTHFFAPAWRNPIVEVIRWPGADPRLVDDLNWIFCMTARCRWSRPMSPASCSTVFSIIGATMPPSCWTGPARPKSTRSPWSSCMPGLSSSSISPTATPLSSRPTRCRRTTKASTIGPRRFSARSKPGARSDPARTSR
jgi:hypothetical protein